MRDVKYGKADEGSGKSLQFGVVRELEGVRGGGDEIF